MSENIDKLVSTITRNLESYSVRSKLVAILGEDVDLSELVWEARRAGLLDARHTFAVSELLEDATFDVDDYVSLLADFSRAFPDGKVHTSSYSYSTLWDDKLKGWGYMFHQLLEHKIASAPEFLAELAKRTDAIPEPVRTGARYILAYHEHYDPEHLPEDLIHELARAAVSHDNNDIPFIREFNPWTEAQWRAALIRALFDSNVPMLLNFELISSLVPHLDDRQLPAMLTRCGTNYGETLSLSLSTASRPASSIEPMEEAIATAPDDVWKRDHQKPYGGFHLMLSYAIMCDAHDHTPDPRLQDAITAFVSNFQFGWSGSNFDAYKTKVYDVVRFLPLDMLDEAINTEGAFTWEIAGAIRTPRCAELSVRKLAIPPSGYEYDFTENASSCFRELGADVAIPALSEAILAGMYDHIDRRVLAAEIVSMFHDARAAEALVHMISDSSKKVRDAATAGLKALPVDAALGGFGVQIRSDGRVNVTHLRSGERSLFSSPRSGPVFAVSRAELRVEGNQGSFEVDEGVVETCSEPVYRDAFVSGEVVVVQGGFEDEACAGVTFEWQLCELDDGQLGIGVTTDDSSLNLIDLRVQSRLDEKIYGMGEQFARDELDLKGRVIPALSQEGGVGRGHQPISSAVDTVSPGSAGSQDSTYYAAPHYLTSDLKSLFLEETDYAVFDFSNFDVTRVRLFAPAMTARVLQGESPLELVERFTAWAGRMPTPPDWVAEGATVALAGDLDDSEEILADLVTADAAISAVWTQTWSGTSNTFIGEQVLWNWIQNPTRHPGWDAFVAKMRARDVRTLCYINPMLRDLPGEGTEPRRDLYAEAGDGGYFVQKEDGSVYDIEVTAFTVGLLDLTNPAAVEWYKDIIKDEMIARAGCAGWMADFGESLPFDAVLHSGVSAATYHNQYPVDWIKLNREAVEEAGALGDVLVFNRSGAARSPRHAMMLWQGDQLTTWDEHDGLVSALHGLINGGLSGISLNHSDVGGYTSLSRYGLGYERGAELLARWAEVSAFTAAMRTHQGNQPDSNAQIYTDAQATARFARMTRLFRALAFYRKQLYAEATDKGWPVVRHMLLHYPDDPRAWSADDQFMFGSEILVAPIESECLDPTRCRYDRDVYLPAGRWVHFWNGRTYGSQDMGSEITIQAPIGQPVAFYREGSPIAAQLESNLLSENLKR